MSQDGSEETIEAGIQAMRREIAELKARDIRQRETIHRRNETIATLRKTVRVLTKDDSENSEDDKNGDDDTNNGLPDAIWDDVQRCVSCATEVVCGFCTAKDCMLEHNYESDEEDDDSHRSISTDDVYVRRERFPEPRGTTPLREFYEDDTPPLNFDGTHEEYTTLLQRGATRLMISTFRLEFHNKSGIVAWADDTIYNTWAGPAMQIGDFWKIMLGRMITLDADDLDGSIWLDDLLEDVLVSSNGMWETIEESPGIWITRPSAKARTEKNAPQVEAGESLIEFLMKTSSDEDEDEHEGGGQDDDDKGLGEHAEPIRTCDDYEASDVDMDELIHVPPSFDTIDTDSENDYEPMLRVDKGSHSCSGTVAEEADELLDDSDSDSPESDWDSEEEFSGDEAVFGPVWA